MPGGFTEGFSGEFGPAGGTPIARQYRIRVSRRGSSDLTASTNVAFTVSTTGGSSAGFLTHLDRWGGQEIRPSEGKTVSRAWTVGIGESQSGEELTPRLMSGGRAAILHRLLDISARPSTDTTWTSTHIRATGRIADVEMGDDVGTYRFTVQDERFTLRRETIFTDAVVDPSDPDPTDTSAVSIVRGSTTASLYPNTLTSRWGRLPEGPTAAFKVSVLSTGSLAKLFKVASERGVDVPGLTRDGEQLILDDLYGQRRGYTSDSVPDGITDTGSTRGDFRTVLAEVDGVNRPMRANDFIHNGQIRGLRDAEGNPLGLTRTVPNELWVVWPSSSRPAAGTVVQVRIIAPTHEPARALPKHIAGGSSDAPGQHMVQVAQDIWDEVGVRYSSTQVAALKGRREHHRGAFMIEKSEQNAARWMQDRLWTHSLIAPVVDARGRISPQSIALPTGEDLPTLGSVITAGTTNVSEHPTLTHPSNELINVLKLKSRPFRGVQSHGRSYLPDGFAEFIDEIPNIGASPEVAGFETFTAEHDTADSGSSKFLGRHDVEVTLPSFAGDETVDFVRQQFFTRYGDGPVRSEVAGLSELEAVDVGGFVQIDVPTFPNLGSSGRGGRRLVQVLSRTDTVRGPRFSLIDAGTTATKLSAPTVAVSRSASQPRHAIDVAVTTTGTGYVLQHAESAGSVSRGSSLWQTAGGNFGAGSTSTVRQLAAGARHHFRAQARAPGRIGSTWSAPGSTTTEGLSAVTSFSSSGVDACRAFLSIVPSMSDYPVEVLKGSTQVAVLPSASSGSTLLYEAEGLTASSTVVYTARHIDGFGGASTDTNLTVNTSTSPNTASPVGFAFALAEGTT